MKNKIIIGLLIIICLSTIYFLSYRITVERERVESLKKENRVFERQIELNNDDLIKYNEERKNAEERTRKAVEYSKTINNDCLHADIPSEFREFLRKNYQE